MPELPDITVYIDALQPRVVGETVRGVRVVSPAVMRTYDPPYDAPVGRAVVGLARVGKRIVLQFNEGGGLFLVIHLMVAGRLRWEVPGKAIPRKVGLAALDFDHGSLILTEQGTRKRAGIWLFSDWEGVASLDRGGIEPLEASADEFATAIKAENRTLKRALTDPRIFS
ncbi:MAG TPA: DNA-formamidopyrimidine glycosylase family protein, partial [Acidimicrobiia bacterium]|nr:DNA-formamidopyrimidine glycosylase family protein [Acidimicrobiia bacterium]